MELTMLIILTIIVIAATGILIYLCLPRSPRGEILPEINGKQLIVHYDPELGEYQFKALRDIYDKEASKEDRTWYPVNFKLQTTDGRKIGICNDCRQPGPIGYPDDSLRVLHPSRTGTLFCCECWAMSALDDGPPTSDIGKPQ
jgi:hypothetical protein